MAGYQDTIQLTLKESIQCAGRWKVWVREHYRSPGGTGGLIEEGYLRQGFAWRTKQGAINAAERRYPGATWTS